ncbi:hypothetical protein LTR66_000090 [Elasticomyces elasticus]|nr:hypothetical protein LTR66_000090 [Elasticomyces elasticus]KAK5007697.1 hypothetical protein LTR28_004958 [Elasticomyces elasticus]
MAKVKSVIEYRLSVSLRGDAALDSDGYNEQVLCQITKAMSQIDREYADKLQHLLQSCYDQTIDVKALVPELYESIPALFERSNANIIRMRQATATTETVLREKCYRNDPEVPGVPNGSGGEGDSGERYCGVLVDDWATWRQRPARLLPPPNATKRRD